MTTGSRYQPLRAFHTRTNLGESASGQIDDAESPGAVEVPCDDRGQRSGDLPVLRARVALSRREPEKAVELLQGASANELGVPRSSAHGFFGGLYPIYIRGEAFLALHRFPEAAAEFQKVLNHSGIVVSDPIGALARLQNGRALALSGDKDKAKIAYLDFLALWKDADADLPVLQQAVTEYAKLNY